MSKDRNAMTEYLTRQRGHENIATMTMFSVFVIAAVACTALGGVSPSVKQPCPGVWCLQVDGLPIPVLGKGKPSICYDTEADMLQGKSGYESQGRTVRRLDGKP